MPPKARRSPLDEFLAVHDDFVIDLDRERFMLTLNPRGFLQRVR